jgi:tetratricopeptide (TPR) repeat protein
VSGQVRGRKGGQTVLPSLYLRLDRHLEALRARSTWMLWVPGLVAFLLYLPTLQGGLVWDDPLFLNHPLYRDPANWAQALSRSFLLSPNYFRPLGIATFLMGAAAGGSAWLHHLVNALLHGLNTTLVALLAVRVTRASSDNLGSWSIVLMAGLLYGLHPALVEAVAFISSRFDLLVTTFLLLALLADYDLRGRRWLRPAAVGLAVFLAALSKEMAVAIVAVLPLWHLSVRAADTSRTVRGADDRQTRNTSSHARWSLLGYGPTSGRVGALSVYLAAGLGLAGYLAVRYAALGYLYLAGSGRDLAVGNLWQHALLVGRSLTEYALLVLWPFTTLRPIHFSHLPLPAGSISACLALAIGIALIAGLLWWIRRDRQTGLLGAATVAALLPVLNLLPLELGGGAFAAERFLLLPLALTALAISQLLRKSTRWAPWPLAALWLLACIAVVQLTVPHWKSEQTLWNWGIRRAPESSTPYTNLALVAIQQGNPALGLALAGQALALDPHLSNAYNQRGLALTHLGDYAAAEVAFARAIEIEPQNPLYWSNLAAALRESDHLGEAERVLLDEALPRDPMLGMAYFNLGLVYLRADRPDLAVPALNRAAELLPAPEAADVQAFLDQTRDPLRWLRLGDLFIANGYPLDALKAFTQAEYLSAPAADLAVGRSVALIALEEWEEAEALLRVATVNAPEDARLYNNLGLVEQARGKKAEALGLFERAARLAPLWPVPRENLEGLEP